MTRLTSNILAACAALALTFGSIGAIVTVPPAQAETPAAIDLPNLA
jgi:hypothetical protein